MTPANITISEVSRERTRKASDSTTIITITARAPRTSMPPWR